MKPITQQKIRQQTIENALHQSIQLIYEFANNLLEQGFEKEAIENALQAEQGRQILQACATKLIEQGFDKHAVKQAIQDIA